MDTRRLLPAIVTLLGGRPTLLQAVMTVMPVLLDDKWQAATADPDFSAEFASFGALMFPTTLNSDRRRPPVRARPHPEIAASSRGRASPYDRLQGCFLSSPRRTPSTSEGSARFR